MGHSIGDLRLILKTILSTQPWLADPMVNRMPWRQEDEDAIRAKVRAKTLTFGVIRTDGMVNPHPPVARAIDTTVGALRAAGYEVVEWEAPPAHAEAFQILVCRSFVVLLSSVMPPTTIIIPSSSVSPTRVTSTR